MQIKEITDPKVWNNFVQPLHPNTFLHSWEWGQVQKKTGEGVRYLGFYNNDVLIGTALIITVNAKRGRHYLIPHGPIVSDVDFEEAVLAELTQYARGEAGKDKASTLRIAPLFVQTEGNKTLFSSLGFRQAPLHVHAELTWVLDISPPEDEILSQMRKTTRHAIKKAEKEGVRVDIETKITTLDRFLPLYEATQHRHNFVPFPRSFLETQAKEFIENGHGFFVIASHKGQDVAAAMLMQFTDTVFYYHGASIKLPSSPPAAQFLQWAAIKEAKRRGAKNYNFWGIAPDNYPNHPFAGITTFKKGFGGYEINYMPAQDLPLSLGYWKLWLVEMLRKKKRGF